jgi:hypothetical protein
MVRPMQTALAAKRAAASRISMAPPPRISNKGTGEARSMAVSIK